MKKLEINLKEFLDFSPLPARQSWLKNKLFMEAGFDPNKEIISVLDPVNMTYTYFQKEDSDQEGRK